MYIYLSWYLWSYSADVPLYHPDSMKKHGYQLTLPRITTHLWSPQFYLVCLLDSNHDTGWSRAWTAVNALSMRLVASRFVSTQINGAGLRSTNDQPGSPTAGSLARYEWILICGCDSLRIDSTRAISAIIDSWHTRLQCTNHGDTYTLMTHKPFRIRVVDKAVEEGAMKPQCELCVVSYRAPCGKITVLQTSQLAVYWRCPLSAVHHWGHRGVSVP